MHHDPPVQVCLLDLDYNLPVQVRDYALGLQNDDEPQSEVSCAGCTGWGQGVVPHAPCVLLSLHPTANVPCVEYRWQMYQNVCHWALHPHSHRFVPMPQRDGHTCVAVPRASCQRHSRLDHCILGWQGVQASEADRRGVTGLIIRAAAAHRPPAAPGTQRTLLQA